jgi:hypothetical protein
VLFVLDEPETFTWPVRVSVPVEGKYVRAEFTAEFANLQGAELDALTADPAEGVPALSHLEMADRVLVGWGDDLKGADGAPLPFTPENKARLLANPRARLAVAGTFLAAARGVAAEKN